MRRVLLAIVMMIGAITPAGRAAMADPATASLTIVGSRTSYIDVRFDQKFELGFRSAEIDFKGDFAGWMIHPLDEPLDYDKRDFIGSYVIKDVGPGDPEYGPNQFWMTLYDRVFSPGRYRVYLLADGPTKITVPFTKGGSSKVLKPVRATSARATAKDIPMTGPKIVNGSVSQPFRVNSGSITFSSIYFFSQEGATVQDTGACLREEAEPSADMQNCEGGGAVGYVIHAQQDYVFTFTSVYPPGAVPTQKYYSYASARATAVDRAIGVAFTIDIP
jgi:hypothetical protein